MRRLLALSGVGAIAAVGLVAGVAGITYAHRPWSPAASMALPRTGHTTTLLSDGSVLVTGGAGARAGRTAERYAPAQNRWSGTGVMTSAHVDHTATLLDDGRVLVAGGRPLTPGEPTAAEIYDPAALTWTPVGRLSTPRARHTATRLHDGRVLAVGGDDVTLQTHAVEHFAVAAEVFNPAGKTWSAAGEMHSGRIGHTTTLLPDGRVLVVGGIGCTGILDSAELYDPNRGAWSAAAPMPARAYGHTAILLTTGAVLVAGGIGILDGTEQEPRVLSWAARYDPATNAWSRAEAMIASRFGHSATGLNDGKVLLVGGAQSGLPAAEVYDPRTGRWSPIRRGIPGGYDHTATLLRDGRVLIAGGQPVVRATAVELYRGR